MIQFSYKEKNMAKEKVIDAKKIKLRYDTNLSVEELAVLAVEENVYAVALLLEKQETLNDFKDLDVEINQYTHDGELAQTTLNILKERLGPTKYAKLCEKAKKEFKAFDKQTQQDRVKNVKKLEKDVVSFVEGVGEMQQAALKLKKGVYKLSHKKDLQRLKTYSDEMKKIIELFSDDEDDGANNQ